MKYSSTLMLYFRLMAKPHFLTLNFLDLPLLGGLVFLGSHFLLFFILFFFFGELMNLLDFLGLALMRWINRFKPIPSVLDKNTAYRTPYFL
jgi:hypothetical protein